MDPVIETHQHRCPACLKVYERTLAICPRAHDIQFPDVLLCFECAAKGLVFVMISPTHFFIGSRSDADKFLAGELSVVDR